MPSLILVRPSITATIVLLLILAGVRSGLAQITPQCQSGCVGVEVTPDGASVPQQPNTGPFTATFSVENTGSLAATYNFSCSATGGISCGPVNPTSKNMAGFAETVVSVTYQVGATGGTLRLTATGPDTDQGLYNVNVWGPPVVALRNHNGTNQDRSLCLSSGAGEAAASVCGDLVVNHALPGYATMGRERSLALVYNSSSALPQPVLVPAITQSGTTMIPNAVLVELSVGGTVRKTLTFPGSGWSSSAQSTRQVVIGFDASGLATGAYPFSLRVQNQYASSAFDAAPITGTLLIVNRTGSEFGKGFWLGGVEQLVFNQPTGQPNGSVLWVGGDGSARLYSQLNTTTWLAPLGGFQDTLRRVSGQYTRRLRHGVTITYDSLGRHFTTTNRANHVTTFNWHPVFNRLGSIGVPPSGVAGTTYTLAYTAQGYLDYIDDPAGRRLDVSIVGSGLLQTLVDPDGRSTTFGYDPTTHFIVSRTNRRGYATLYEHANNLRLTKVTIPVGRTAGDAATAVTRFEPWDEKGIITPLDTANSHTRIIGPISDTATFWVNRFGQPSKILSPLGVQTFIDRNDARFPAQATNVRYPLARQVRMFYDGRGNVIQLRDDVVGLQTKATSYVYGSTTAPDSPTRVADSTGATTALVTNYAYNALGLTQQVTAPNGHVTKFAYSALNLVKVVTELSVPVWNPTTRTESNDSLHTGFAFNALGNVTSDTSPSGRVKRYTRDNAQRVTDSRDPASHLVRYAYDALNRIDSVTEVITPTPVVSRTTYDVDVVSSVSDPRGVTRNWRYDKAGRAIEETDDWGRTEVRFYNGAGQVDSIRPRTYGGVTGNGVVAHRYDRAGRRIKHSWPSRQSVPRDSVTFGYDVFDRITSATQSGREVRRTWFGNGLLESEIQSVVGATGSSTHTHAYDRAGRRTHYRIGVIGDTTRSDSIWYKYKATGDLQWIGVRWRRGTRDSVQFAWDAMGRRDTVRYSNGTVVKFAYDKDGALRVLCATHPVSIQQPDVFNLTVYHDDADSDGMIRRTRRVPAPGQPIAGCGTNALAPAPVSFAYDERHQLLSDSQSSTVRRYAYDQSGNLKKFVESTPNAPSYLHTMLANHNQLERRTRELNHTPNLVDRYLYDANGAREVECPTSTGCDSTASSGPDAFRWRRYFYDGLGRMRGRREWRLHTDVFELVGSPDQCLYDPVGRLVNPCEGSATLGFDDQNVVRTTVDQATFGWTFVHGPGLDDPIMGQYIRPGGEIARAYWITDGQHRQYAVGWTDGHDAAQGQEYLFGGGTYAGGMANSSGFGVERSTPGEVTKLSFFRNRWYDQQTGRWTQEDPIGVAGGLNLYQFNGNNPVSNTDPFGLCPNPPGSCKALGVAVGGGIGATVGGIVAAGCAAGSGGVCALGAAGIVGFFSAGGATFGGLVGSVVEASEGDVEDGQPSASDAKNPDGSAKEAGQQYEEITEAQSKNPDKIQSTKKSKQRDRQEIRQEAEDALNRLRGNE